MNINWTRLALFGSLVLTILAQLPFARLVKAGEISFDEPKSYGGTLYLGFDHKPLKLNPILTTRSLSMGVMELVFNRLVRYNSNGQIIPDLAESWEISSDGLVYIFRLRKNVKFHDGIELTADDVHYTYQMIKDPATQSPYSLEFSIVEKFQIVDRYTFQVTLKEHSASFLCNLAREIVPKHVYERAAIDTGDFNYRPIGTGPFKFVSWEDDDTIKLEANLDYFEGRPYFDKVIYKTYPNRSEVWSALMRGEIDLMIFVSVADYEITREDSTFDTFAYPSLEYYALFYNLKDPILSDIRVRQAIACAINRRKLIEKLEQGYGRECFGPFSDASWAFNRELKFIHYDPVKARELLRQAGWKEDNDGFFQKEGKELTLRVLVDSINPKLRKIAMAIRQQLQEAGIKLEVKFYEGEILVSDLEAFQMDLRMNLGALQDPDAEIRNWHSQARRKSKVRVHNDPDPEIDKLIELAEVTIGQEAQKEIYKNIHRLIYEKQLACFLYFPYIFHASNKRIGGTEKYLNTYMPVYTIKDFYLRESSGKRR